jgi:hypothetical protein
MVENGTSTAFAQRFGCAHARRKVIEGMAAIPAALIMNLGNNHNENGGNFGRKIVDRAHLCQS